MESGKKWTCPGCNQMIETSSTYDLDQIESFEVKCPNCQYTLRTDDMHKPLDTSFIEWGKHRIGKFGEGFGCIDCKNTIRPMSPDGEAKRLMYVIVKMEEYDCT